MKYSINWLKELSGTGWTTAEMVDNLTMRAFEVEKEEFDVPQGVIIGKILEIKKHPDADRLQIAKVQTSPQPSPSEREEALMIVCGATNIETGQKVPVALPGTVLPGGLEIKEAEIRGVRSSGMLCAMDELGIGKDHSGIFILDEDAEIGGSLQEYLENHERSLEIKVLPDRAHDAFCHYGLAKEIATLEGKESEYDIEKFELPEKDSKELEIEIEDPELCPRYIGLVIKGIEVKESPDWIKEKLRDSGLRPINNIVDATNLVMLELGNPLHAFDLDKVKNGQNLKIVVRKAKKGEKITLLDGDVKELEEEMLLIANPEGNLGLAGIKGGLNSGITEETKDLVIEVANFNAVSIRKTRTHLGISTDASIRYEKDIDPNLPEKAAARVLEIIKDIAGGELEGIVDKYPKKLEPWEVSLEEGYVERLLGEKVPGKEIENILKLIGVAFKKADDKYFCQIPTRRLDLRTQEDLIEEIGRVWGYDHIEGRAIRSAIRPMKLPQRARIERDSRRAMVALGFSEVYNYSFYSKKEEGLAGKSASFEIENPADPEDNFFRASLIPGLLKNVSLNLGNFSDFRIFEIGKAYEKKSEAPLEKHFLSGVVVDSIIESPEDSFQKTKGLLEALGNKLGFSLSIKKDAAGPLSIFREKEAIGKLMMISKEVQESFGIKRFTGSIWTFEIDVDRLLEDSYPPARTFQELPRFPKAPRDISFLVPENSKVGFEEMEKIIRMSGGDILENMELFDVFMKDGQRSYSLHLSFMSKDRTLSNEEIEEKMEMIIKNLEKEGFGIRK